MSDSILAFSFDNLAVRGQLVRLENSFQTILQQHHYPHEISKLLGETLLTSILLMAPLKLEGNITVQFDGEGPISMLAAKCNHNYDIRALATFDKELIQSKVQEVFQKGRLAVTVQPDHTVKPYQSIINLSGGSITQAMESYFIQSEQLPTRFIFASNENTVAALMLQQLPESTDNTENDWQHAITLANSVTEEELLTLPYEDILHRLYHQEEIRIYPKEKVQFKCPCTVEKMSMAVKTMGQAEAEHLLSNKQAITVTCEYCNNQYDFGKSEVMEMFKAPH